MSKLFPQQTHLLKILPPYFAAVVSGSKTFEIRDGDRDFRAGDKVVLREAVGNVYSGAVVHADIGYVSWYGQKDGFVVFSLLNVGEIVYGESP